MSINNMTPSERAMMRIALMEEMGELKQGQMNTSPDFLGEFPRMMYRKTDEKVEHVISTDKNGLPREVSVLNDFGGLLCDTEIANSLDEAEKLASEGWELSPQAAYGEASAFVTASSAKDDEIAALKAKLAAYEAGVSGDVRGDDPAPKRGPGRPPKVNADL